MTKLNEYVMTAEAADILGVSQNTVRQWAETGAIPVRRNPANGYRLFRRTDLEAFLSQVESVTDSEPGEMRQDTRQKVIERRRRRPS